jgi:DnaK suppressor protein
MGVRLRPAHRCLLAIRLEMRMARPRSGRRSARTVETGPVRKRGDETALAPRLPALRSELEQQRHFRREQLALVDPDATTSLSPAGPIPTDLRDEDARRARREVDALVAAGARRALAEIELALVRMRTGRYGLCRSCGTRIPIAVLEAVPKTTLCLACQHRLERRSDQDGAARTRNRVPRRRKVGSGRGQ